MSLDGLTGTVGLGNPAQLQITGSMTISGWINPSTFPADDEAIVSKRIVGGPGYQLDTTVDTGVRTVGFKLTNSSGGDMIRYGATTLQPNTWYYVAGVYNATTQTMDVYLNGVLDDGTLVGPVTTSQQSSTANVTIGARTSAYFFNGRIDEVRIYNQALTGTRVQTDMNTPIGGGNPTDWSTFFQSNGRTGFGIGNSGLTPSSASSLKLAWTASDSGNPESGVFAQPIVVGGTTYWGSFDGNEHATDATGHLLWKTFIGHVNDPTCTDPSSAGVVSTATVRSDVPVGGASSVLYVAGGDTKMYALNAATGAILWSTSLGVGPDHFIWSSPAVFGNSVYIGESSFGDCPLVQGQFLQLNRVTGAIQNTFNVVPNGCVGAGVWGSPAVDPIAGTIYFTTGNSDPTSAAGEPLGQSIVEVSASNLSLLGSWEVPAAQQTDDPDFGATPTLFSGVVGGQNTPLVGAIDKNGIFYTLNATRSQPVRSGAPALQPAAATPTSARVTFRSRHTTVPPCTWAATSRPSAHKAAVAPSTRSTRRRAASSGGIASRTDGRSAVSWPATAASSRPVRATTSTCTTAPPARMSGATPEPVPSGAPLRSPTTRSTRAT